MRKRLVIVAMVVMASLGLGLIRHLSGQRSELVTKVRDTTKVDEGKQQDVGDEADKEEQKSIKEVLKLERPNSISVSDIPPRSWLVIDEVRIEESGFAVVYEDDSLDRDNIIGSSNLLEKGENKDVAVFLRRDLKNGEEIFIGLRIDDGDGFFEFTGRYDKNIVRADGAAILESAVVGD